MVLSQNKIEARKRLKYTVSLFAGSIDITRVLGAGVVQPKEKKITCGKGA